jgi:hypothetical protein
VRDERIGGIDTFQAVCCARSARRGVDRRALHARGGVVWAWVGVYAAIVVVLVALLSLWLLIRVTIDRRLFASLANATVTLNEADRLGALDLALLQLGWIDQAKAGRPLDARVRGVAGLLRQSVGLAVLQLLIVAAAAWWGAFL